jgi:hypothetical protein
MPIVATVELDWLDMAVLLQSALPAPLAGELGSTAGPFHYRIGGNRRQRSGLEIPIAVFAAPHNSGDNPMPTIRPL